MINDNNPKGPLVRVIKVRGMSKQILDNEPFQEKVYLECGHWLYNTWGNQFKMKRIDDLINCKLCGDIKP